MGLGELITAIYPDASDSVLAKIEKEIAEVESFENVLTPDWYKHIQMYVTYPDAFLENGKEPGFLTLKNKLDHIRELGMNAIHVLPFFQTPMIDMGFDVGDYMSVREGLGGKSAFREFVNRSHELGIGVFIDIVLNHTSDQHWWFQKALEGDERYRDLYINTIHEPLLTKQYINNVGVWAEYKVNGHGVKSRVIFPEQSGDLPHWVHCRDDHWYYHTFYPSQIDLNWQNPDVFIEFSKIIAYWASWGLNFRLDAVPFIAKDIYTGEIENTDKGHLIIQALNVIAKKVSDSSVFLVEVCQPMELTKKYFGRTECVESELAYNFPMMQSIWAAVIGENPIHVWEALEKTEKIPDCAQWVNFLRNHDELTLEFADAEMRTMIYSALIDKGLSFREEFGISGRTANFLDNDPKRILISHMLLASLPGIPAIIYGDEVGKTNDPRHMKEQHEFKKRIKKDQDLAVDTRDANRGVLTQEDLESENVDEIKTQMAKIFNARKKFAQLAETYPKFVETESVGCVFAALYSFEDNELAVYINLSDKEVNLRVEGGFQDLELSINEAGVSDGNVSLPPYSGLWLTRE